MKKQNRKTDSKLALNRETLTTLTPAALEGANGGARGTHPTVTLTPMGEMAWSDPKKSGPMLASIPLGRFAKPAEVATVVAFLLGDGARMISGVTLPVDGGFLAT